MLSEFSRELEQLRVEVVALKAENAVLREKVQMLEDKGSKDSHNSSKPPSTDRFRKPAPKSLRKRSGRKKTKPRDLLERLDEYRQEVLAFMYDFRLLFDNNLAERDIRMMKVQQKISGIFRSYTSTARKNALGAMDAIAYVFTGNPFVRRVNTA